MRDADASQNFGCLMGTHAQGIQQGVGCRKMSPANAPGQATPELRSAATQRHNGMQFIFRLDECTMYELSRLSQNQCQYDAHRFCTPA